MKKTKIFRALFVLIFSFALVAPAQGGNFFAGAGVGTLGAGLDLGYQFNNFIKVRLNGNYLPLDYSLKYNDIDYDMELRNLSAGLLLDLHPFGGDLRLTAGAYYRDFSVDLTATPKYGAEIGGTWYNNTDLGKVEAEITWDKFAPYAGIGWGMGSGTGNSFSFDFNLGAMTLRGVDVEYTATGAASSPALREDLDREAAKLKSDLGDWNIYPVVSFFLSFRF